MHYSSRISLPTMILRNHPHPPIPTISNISKGPPKIRRWMWTTAGLMTSQLSYSSSFPISYHSFHTTGMGGRAWTTAVSPWNHRIFPCLSFSSSFSSSSFSLHNTADTMEESTFSPITYYTCRHTYEDTLIQELLEYSHISSSHHPRPNIDPPLHPPTPRQISSPCPGLVRVTHPSPPTSSSSLLDPIYALQILPYAMEVHQESINSLAKAAIQQLQSSSHFSSFQSAPRGSLSLHTIVPGMLKGSPKPPMERRVTTIAEVMMKQLKKMVPCARPATSSSSSSSISNQPQWILQLLLMTPEHLIVSLTPISSIPILGGSWPCVTSIAGLASAEMVNQDQSLYPTTSHSPSSSSSAKESRRDRRQRNPRTRRDPRNAKAKTPPRTMMDVPSSAYRKLLEAISCMGYYPPSLPSSFPVVDLGATPGGWTAALRRMGCQVIAVDRADLAPHLMNDPKTTFVKGDAFTFQPPSYTSPSSSSSKQEQWMVSDIIAFPERVSELLEDWCGNHMAQRMIVTVKFKGKEPSWEALDMAMTVAMKHGYVVRCKHFFNNKNEVTLMIVSSDTDLTTALKSSSYYDNDDDDDGDWKMKSMFPIALPASK